MNNYLLDVDVAKVNNLNDVKKELLHSLEELNARGLKTSYQWYVYFQKFYKIFFTSFILNDALYQDRGSFTFISGRQ